MESRGHGCCSVGGIAAWVEWGRWQKNAENGLQRPGLCGLSHKGELEFRQDFVNACRSEDRPGLPSEPPQRLPPAIFPVRCCPPGAEQLMMLPGQQN